MQALCQCMSFRREFHTVYLYIGCCDMLAVRLHTILVNGSEYGQIRYASAAIPSSSNMWSLSVSLTLSARRNTSLSICRQTYCIAPTYHFYFTNKINSGAERACSCFKHLKACVRSHIIPICASMKHDMTVGRKRHKHALGCT